MVAKYEQCQCMSSHFLSLFPLLSHCWKFKLKYTHTFKLLHYILFHIEKTFMFCIWCICRQLIDSPFQKAHAGLHVHSKYSLQCKIFNRHTSTNCTCIKHLSSLLVNLSLLVSCTHSRLAIIIILAILSWRRMSKIKTTERLQSKSAVATEIYGGSYYYRCFITGKMWRVFLKRSSQFPH